METPPALGRIPLSRKCWNIIRADPVLFRYPFLGLIGSLIVALVMLMLLSGLRIFINITEGIPLTFGQLFGIFLIFIVFYVMNYIFSTYSNAAFISAVFFRVGGEEVTNTTGFQVAFTRVPFLVGYGALSSTIGVVARILAPRGQRKTLPSSVIGSLVGTEIADNWNVIVYLALPVLLAETDGLFKSMKRSAALLKKTFGEEVQGQSGFGFLFGLAALASALPGGVLVFFGMAGRSSELAIFGFIVIFLAVSLVTLLAGAINGVFGTSLYLYCSEGEPGPYLLPEELRSVFEKQTVATPAAAPASPARTPKLPSTRKAPPPPPPPPASDDDDMMRGL
jgi:hypothetical protein